MESLAHLVTESLLRHGLEPRFDHRRLQWSKWFRCQDSFSLVLAPCKPGLFALGEEVISPGELPVGEGKRMLALFRISEANDLGMALGRLFLSGNPARERFASGRCFARYVVIEDQAQRRTALAALRRWMVSSTEAASGIQPAIAGDAHATPDTQLAPDALVRGAEPTSAGYTQEAGLVSGHDFSRAAIATTSTPALAAASSETAGASARPESSNRQAQIGPPMPFPSGF